MIRSVARVKGPRAVSVGEAKPIDRSIVMTVRVSVARVDVRLDHLTIHDSVIFVDVLLSREVCDRRVIDPRDGDGKGAAAGRALAVGHRVVHSDHILSA